MRITISTTPQEVAEKTKNVMNLDAISNMLLKNAGNLNGFVSEKKIISFGYIVFAEDMNRRR